jgi:hypothetical protein
VDVRLLFYAVHVQVRDALFGTVGARSVDLTFPNHRTTRYALNSQGAVTLPILPRGDYVLTAVGSGPRIPLPLVISRNQKVDAGFFSWLDILVVVGAVVVLAALLAFAGRLRRRSRIARSLAFAWWGRPIRLAPATRAVVQPTGSQKALAAPLTEERQADLIVVETDRTAR